MIGGRSLNLIWLTSHIINLWIRSHIVSISKELMSWFSKQNWIFLPAKLKGQCSNFVLNDNLDIVNCILHVWPSFISYKSYTSSNCWYKDLIFQFFLLLLLLFSVFPLKNSKLWVEISTIQSQNRYCKICFWQDLARKSRTLRHRSWCYWDVLNASCTSCRRSSISSVPNVITLRCSMFTIWPIKHPRKILSTCQSTLLNEEFIDMPIVVTFFTFMYTLLLRFLILNLASLFEHFFFNSFYVMVQETIWYY